MKYFETNSTNPYYNLAFEEYIQRNYNDDSCLILWQNDNTIVYGLHQNPLEEINFDVAKDLRINTVRRGTGGGTVYHDLGNLNFSYITDWNDGINSNYHEFLQPVITAFAELGLTIEVQGRNDLVLKGKKISGSAQCLIKNRILHHGTLLIDSNLDILQSVLNVSQDKISSKGIKSVKSRVTNIQEHIDYKLHIDEVKTLLIKHWFANQPFEQITLTPNDIHKIQCLEQEKYRTWEWLYGRSPKFDFKNKKRFSGGTIEVNLDVKDGIIKDCIINGDFLSLKPVSELEQAIIGCHYMYVELQRILSHFPLTLYFGEIAIEDVLSCFF